MFFPQVCVKQDDRGIQHDFKIIQRTYWASVEEHLTICTKSHMINATNVHFKIIFTSWPLIKKKKEILKLDFQIYLKDFEFQICMPPG